MKRRLCIAMHDVSPVTWLQCSRLLAGIDAIARVPLTLAVVPQFHGRDPVHRAHEFRSCIDERIADGDEIALHGWRHRDESPITAGSWIARRVMTAGEGEFAQLSEPDAIERIRRGRALLDACGWPASGFIPPAWLVSEGARSALTRSGFSYMSSRATLDRLTDGRSIAAPCITVSARSAWRRAASKLWLRAMERATANVPLLRIALHPVDAMHDDIALRWRALIARLLESRTVVTKQCAIAECA